LIIAGSAPVDPELGRFFEALGIRVAEGYGMTETSGVAFVNPYGRTRPGTVGTAIETVEFAVAPDSELLLCGDSICQGYLDPEHNREAFTADGWLRTGDLVAVSAEGYVSVIGRKKDLIITDGGENITPERLETALASHPLIKDAAVFGDGKPFVVAVLNVDPDRVAQLGPGAVGDELVNMLQPAVDDINRRLAVFERVRKFVLASEDFSAENGELTVTLKKRRNVIRDRYREEIDGLYATEAVPRPAAS
jgi:long-chain acyl-CoA synthetase